MQCPARPYRERCHQLFTFPPGESGRAVACTLFSFVAWYQGGMGEVQPVAMTVAAGYCKDSPQPTRAGGFSRVRSLEEGMERSRNAVARRTPEGCGYQVSTPPEGRWRVSFDAGLTLRTRIA